MTTDTETNEGLWQRRDDSGVEVGDLMQLRTRRQLGRRYLPFLKTWADFDIACEIGYHELCGTPLTVKQLMLLDIAPSVTVFRRLERLCTLGVVLRRRSLRDGRVHELRLSPAVHRLFAIYARSESHRPDAAAEIVNAAVDDDCAVIGKRTTALPRV